MNLCRFLMMISIIGLLTACPYPVYKKLRPEGHALVLSKDGNPIEGAKVFILTRAYPTPIHESDLKVTDINGIAEFKSRSELKTEVVFLHGSVEYFWNWCVEKAGFVTFKTSYSDGSIFKENLNITLLPGESTACLSQ